MYKVCDSLMEKTQKRENGNRVLTLVLAIVILLMTALFVFTKFICISVYVDGASMSPTLRSGDVLFANTKMVAEDGDVIVIDGEKQKLDGKGYDWLIKRAIVVGQKDKTIIVKIKDGKVLVGEKGGELKQLLETYLPEGTATTPTSPGYETSWEVGEGEIFYLGDNRSNSRDSRHAPYGTCKVSQVVGVVPEWAISARWLSGFLFDVGQFFANLF